MAKQDWPIKIFKKKKGVADCSSGESCDMKAKVNSGGEFNFTKKRYKKIGGGGGDIPEIEKKIPTNSMHMNVRDLGGNPGQQTTHYDKSTNTAERKRSEVKLTKARKYFGKK